MKIKLLLILLMISPAILTGQRIGLYESRNYFSCNISGGYTAFVENYKEAKTIGGLGSNIGVGYEFRKSGFWFGVNADIQLYNSMLRNELNDYSVMMKDTEGDLVTYHYKMKNWTESQRALYLNVPVMLGYYGYSGFYFGLGLKYGINLFGRFKSQLDYKTYASYDRYIEDFENMPNHYYTDYTSKYNAKADKFTQNLSLCGEIGGEIYNNQFYHYGARSLIMLKLALCIEYGVSNIIINEESKEMQTINQHNPSQLDIFPFYDSKITTKKMVRPLYVGLKLTLLLTPKTCRTCPF